MRARIRRLAPIAAAGLLLLQAARATVIARLSFEDLIDTSDLIISGKVTRSWAAWDAHHKYVWTHYEVAVKWAQKGAPGATVEMAEPGGALDGIVTAIAGTVVYTPGENVLVFLQRMPNGYLRTTGWGQGRYLVDSNGRIHADSILADSILRGLDIVDVRTPATASTPLRTPLATLEGMSLNELALRIVARIRATAGAARTR
ncbi:MAG: hypothetical protein ABSB15_00135 [Bryobacteraceae bacterium]